MFYFAILLYRTVSTRLDEVGFLLVLYGLVAGAFLLIGPTKTVLVDRLEEDRAYMLHFQLHIEY